MGYISWFALRVLYDWDMWQSVQRDHLGFIIRHWCQVEISLCSGANNEFLVVVTVTLLEQVATRAKAVLSVERGDDTSDPCGVTGPFPISEMTRGYGP